jgi:uncharacterized protein (DUF1684 family)
MKNTLCLTAFFCFLFTHAQENWTKESVENFQKTINNEYANREESPLTEEDFTDFRSLDFFPINEKFAVVATFVKSENERVFKMKTTGTKTPEYVKYGELHFNIDGQNFNLNVYQNIELSTKDGYKDYLFLPFSDLTCGKESYIGGRYIDMRFPESEIVLVDFNKAYNPYCAYNHKYSCPIVPLENDLEIEILAGVKKFHD